MYRIRFHGRGGQGIKTAAQVLGTAFFLEGFEVQDAPRYGAERRGAPIFAYVRAARGPIHERGVIARPDAVLVADETLVALPAAGVLQGLAARTVLVIASAETAEAWRARLALAGSVLTLAPGEAGGPLVGMACAGAAARLVGMIARERLEAAVREEIAKLGAGLVERSLGAALAAYDAFAPHAGLVAEGEAVAAAGYRPPEWIDLPRDTAHFAAPDIDAPATSVAAKTGAWRTLRPVIDYARCQRCSWVCGTLCPDSAIAVEADRTPRIDYDHCKGCMVCVAVCPRHAIAAEPERARAEAGA